MYEGIEKSSIAAIDISHFQEMLQENARRHLGNKPKPTPKPPYELKKEVREARNKSRRLWSAHRLTGTEENKAAAKTTYLPFKALQEGEAKKSSPGGYR